MRLWRFLSSSALAGTGVLAWIGAVPAAEAQVLSTAAYCDLMSNYCIEEVLHNEDFCLAFVDDAVPGAMATGSLTDTSGNSLGCRMHYALLAETASGAGDESARLSACEKASLTGGEICGSFCDNYCDLAMATCNRDNNSAYGGTPLFMDSGTPPSPSRSHCESACAAYSDDVLEGVSQTDQLFGYGDTVQCRIHHLQAAVVEGQDNANAYGLHCGHARPESNDDLCSDIAEPNVINYCVFALEHCEGANALFPPSFAHGDCVNFMNTVLASGDYSQDGFMSFADSATNSVGCLNNRVMLATMDAATYCAEGDWDSRNWIPDGAAVCAASVAVPTSGKSGLVALGMLLLASGWFASERLRARRLRK